MTYENFLKVILKQQLLDRQITAAYDLKIDFFGFVDGYHQIISFLIKEIYGDEGYDWYSWFCYESDYGSKGVEAWDEDKNPICYSYESLHEYLEKNHLIINKQESKVMQEEQFISLYDFQGHKDNEGHGKALYNYAISQGVKPQTRDVENPKYKGKVMLYPKSTIEQFFKLLEIVLNPSK